MRQRLSRPVPGGLLLAPSARRTVLLVVVGAALVVAVLGVGLALSDPGEGALDQVLDGPVVALLESQHWLTRPFADLGEPVVALPAVVVVAATALLLRRWTLAVLAVVGPAVSVGLAEYVLKPLVGRDYAGQDSYPSGHMTVVCSVALVLLLALLGSRVPHRTTVWLVTAGVIVVVMTGLGLVALHYHFMTDVIGGAGVAVVVVLGLALLLDQRPTTASRP